jgi:hypothetical protein
MPFIKQEIRKSLEQGEVCKQFGDLCYLAYKSMIGLWKTQPRWTTYHIILKTVQNDPISIYGEDLQKTVRFDSEDLVTAVLAAEKVFFMKYVWPYELEKEAENGEIL